MSKKDKRIILIAQCLVNPYCRVHILGQNFPLSQELMNYLMERHVGIIQYLCPERHDPELNYFKINASKPLSYWRKKGWIYPDDPRGWFQWYCRYYMGRRLGEEDRRQIARWIAIKRHIAQIYKHCSAGDMKCRPRQRQAVMHWAYDSRIM